MAEFEINGWASHLDKLIDNYICERLEASAKKSDSKGDVTGDFLCSLPSNDQQFSIAVAA